MMVSLAFHELAHALTNKAKGGLLVRLSADEWEYRPHDHPLGVDVILAQLGGATGERIMELGAIGAANMLDSEGPDTFFRTSCASDEDLLLVDVDPNTCAGLVKQHQLIERLAHALNELGLLRIKAFARSMEATQIGDGIKLEGLPALPPVRPVH